MPAVRPRRPAPEGARALVRPAAGVALALLAVALLPFPAASVSPGGGYPDVAALGDAVARGLEHWWRSGAVDAGPELERAVAFWARFHVVKAVLGGVLLVLVGRLARRTWHEYVPSPARGRRARLAVAGVLEAPLLLLAVLLVAANVQGALAPMSSVLGLLPVGRVGAGSGGAADGGLARTVREIRRALESPDASGPPALTHLVTDFAAYHAVMVGVGAVVTLAVASLAVRVWRRRGSDGRPWRVRAPRVVAATTFLGFALGFAVVTAANLSTFLHPAPALLGFFEGGA